MAGGRGGETVKIREEEAAFTYKTVRTEMAGWFSVKPTFDVLVRETGEEYLL